MARRRVPAPEPSAAQLEEIEELGSLQFTAAEVLMVTGLGALSPEQATAYRRGQLKAEAMVRKSILRMAQQGSSPAQKEFLGLVERRKRLEEEDETHGP